MFQHLYHHHQKLPLILFRGLWREEILVADVVANLVADVVANLVADVVANLVANCCGNPRPAHTYKSLRPTGTTGVSTPNEEGRRAKGMNFERFFY